MLDSEKTDDLIPLIFKPAIVGIKQFLSRNIKTLFWLKEIKSLV